MGIKTSKHASTSLPNTMDFGILENMLQETSVTPICLPIEFIKSVTCNFSKEQELGRGGCGVVYKGVLQNGKIIAVKKLSEIHLEEDQFEREITYLIGVKHQNIVQLIGYCAESRWEATDVGGKYVMAETRNRMLCFEYLPKNSLDMHISGESCGLEWQTRYAIIRGVCCGLHYLHAECRIVHLDLKPQNILLDVNMLPKLADFGISRLFDTQQSRIITERRAGIFGYMAPEYITNGLITTKSDMFSLGVIIIELITGCKEYPQSSEMPYEHFIENVIGNWRDRLKKTMGYIASEICSQQIHRCIVLALKCVDPDPKERPSACDIVQMLNEPESTNGVFDKNEEPTAGQTGSEPHDMSLHYLKEITNNFSNEQILGRGGFGVVYKGVLQNGKTIAVKKLVQSVSGSHENFEKEVDHLMKLKHPNIVQLVGYCYETQHLRLPHEGKFIFAWNTETLLCLEYLPNGSLDKYISDATAGLDWNTRYKIIEGISYGLHHLHEQSNGPIVHLDLKPANILLDENMLPKITDFGLSRLFDQNQTICTANSTGTLGYMSPEYQLRGIITPMSDIFSLGVIIMEVITGHRDYPYVISTSSQDCFIEIELRKWRNRFQEELGYASLETDCRKIERCIQIGLICVNPERTKRPTMKQIIDMLQG